MGNSVRNALVCLVGAGVGWLVIIVPLRPRPAKRLLGVGRRNAPGVPFSIGGFRGVCRAGVICGLSGGFYRTGCLWMGL